MTTDFFRILPYFMRINISPLLIGGKKHIYPAGKFTDVNLHYRSSFTNTKIGNGS